MTAMAGAQENTVLCVPRASSGLQCDKLVLSKQPLPVSCPPNHVLIKVDRFGFSTNNITYQTLAEHPHFRYFDFHPVVETETASPKTHGLIPVWGFGTVVKSSHAKIEAGERVYGYFAMAKYLLLLVSSAAVNRYSFYVSRPHLPSDRRPYNQVIRCSTDPQYIPNPSYEDLTMLYRPLFWTSYWCEDWLFCSRYRAGASSILISSASSKTAFTLAYLIQKRIKKGEIEKYTKVFGLTSKKNFDFTRGLNLYHEVLTYDSFASSPVFSGKANERWIYVDLAANESLNKDIFSILSSPSARMAACITLGLTNVSPKPGETKSVDWNENSASTLMSNSSTTANTSDGANDPQPLPQAEHFFMVEWLELRRRQLLPDEIFTRQNEAWRELMADCVDWVKIDRYNGAHVVKQAYEQLVRDGIGPEIGLIWSLWESDQQQIQSRL
ncbi:hypothetical protein AX17_003187 [Amanita inopinata Kibby_2008]|nr:hypothetical protein AX17_003187 [Amanita inopinata Kibby_2008]